MPKLAVLLSGVLTPAASDVRFCPRIAVRLTGGVTAPEVARPFMATCCMCALIDGVAPEHWLSRCFMACAGRKVLNFLEHSKHCAGGNRPCSDVDPRL